MLRLRFGFWFGMKTTTFLSVWVKGAVSLLGMVKNSIGFFFFLYFFLVAENMIISIFDITYGKFASLMLCYDDDGFF